MVDFDSKDRRLLYELDKNSRQSTSRLAKKTGLSKDSVAYRINRLLKEGVIKSFNTVIDTKKAGYTSFRLFIKLYNTTTEIEDKIFEFLLKNENLIWIVKVDGKWDINTWFAYKTIEEMNDFWKKLLEKYNNFILEREFGIYTNMAYFGRNYLLNGQGEKFSMPTISMAEPTKLKDVDLKILELLSQNARIPVIELAKKTGLTSKTIITKIRWLKENKVIHGFRTEFDLEKLGYKYYKIHITTFNTTKEKLERLNLFIFEHPNIIYQDEVLGGHDIEIEVQVKNDDELRKLLSEIRNKFGNMIRNYEVLRYYQEYRLKFFPSASSKE